MPFVAPIPIIRRNVIIKKLRECGATSPETAKTFAEANIINPNGFKMITRRLVKLGVIHMTSDGRYYL